MVGEIGILGIIVNLFTLSAAFCLSKEQVFVEGSEGPSKSITLNSRSQRRSRRRGMTFKIKRERRGRRNEANAGMGGRMGKQQNAGWGLFTSSWHATEEEEEEELKQREQKGSE